MKGIYTATLIPLNSDLSCNHLELASHCLSLIEEGADGITLCGTTGEGPSFSVQERRDILRHLIHNGVSRHKIILGGSCLSISDTVEMAEISVAEGCLALLLAPPCFYKNVEEEGVIAFYRAVAKKVPQVKIILYHIPQLTGVPLSLSVIEALRKEFPNQIAGIKESEGNLPFLKNILHRFPGFPLFIGKETHIIEGIHLGAAGVICGLANICQPLITTLYAQGKKGLAPNPREIEELSQSFRNVQFIPALKAALMKKKGDAWFWVRPPLCPVNEVNK